MAKQTSEKLTLVNLSKHDKQNDETQTISLADGKFTLEISKKFRQTQIQKLIIDIQEAAETMRNEDIDMEDISHIFLIYQMCTLKYFTSLPLEHLDLSKKLDLAKMIAAAKQLMDSGIFTEIIESFDPIEMTKINDAMKASKVMGEQIGEMMSSIVLGTKDNVESGTGGDTQGAG